MAVIGIDLGTTMSAVASVNEFGKAEILMNADGEPVTPSVVYFESPNAKTVGVHAKNEMGSDPARVIELVKNEMGQKKTWTMNGETYGPEQVSAVILRRLKEDAEARLGQKVEGAVITVPAIFGDSERNATRTAAQIAGLEVLALLEEPVAAAIAYAVAGGSLSTEGSNVSAPTTSLIYDLGGGTFDITVMRSEGARFTMLATDGNRRLGGRDWDNKIVDYVASLFEAEHGVDPTKDVEANADLSLRAEDAKKALTRKESTNIVCMCDGSRTKAELSRTLFEEISADLLDQTADKIRLVMEFLEESGRITGGWNAIDKVLLVGGSSRMPQVIRMLRELTGKEPEMLEVDAVVAQGAALYSVMKIIELAEETGQTARLANLGIPAAFEDVMGRAQVNRVSSFALGIIAGNPETGEIENCIILPMNSPIPDAYTSRFRTAVDDQKMIQIEVLEGESTRPENCLCLGEGLIDNIPPGLPKGSPVEVTIGLDEEGCIMIHAQELVHGKQLQMQLVRAVQMDDASVATSRARLSRDILA